MIVSGKIRWAYIRLERRYLYWWWKIRPVSRAGRPHQLPGPLLVSLTSHPPRFPSLAPILKALLSQDVKADKTILWIAEEDYLKLPKSVLDLQSKGLSIEKYKNIRSYLKLIPALEKYPEHFIVTADDDIIYETGWLKSLVSEFRGDTKEVICRRAHTITVTDNGAPEPYGRWQWEIASEDQSPFTFPTGCGGTLYPPGVFDSRVTDDRTFMRLAPTADDLWFFWMASLCGAGFRRVGPVNSRLVIPPQSQSVSLGTVNNGPLDNNTIQMNRLVEMFGFPPNGYSVSERIQRASSADGL